MSSHEKHLMYNSLACIANLCLGKVTTVELRNESHVTGRITCVDGFMNITMSQAKFHDPTRRVKTFETFFAAHRLVRGIQGRNSP
jgi:small nuclear ribonucleoprotein (snRNP)-like protein